jgi:hypothetical protein
LTERNSTIEIISTKEVQSVFESYPGNVKNKLLQLRGLIIESAAEIEGLSKIEETLKWGEPSYLVKGGSTIRIDWKAKAPAQYAIYFKCTSLLVPTFKEVYGNQFQYEKNRAIVFPLDGSLPKSALKKCIQAALTYHRVKQLPNLGIQ